MKVTLNLRDETNFILRGPQWEMPLKPWATIQEGPYWFRGDLENGETVRMSCVLEDGDLRFDGSVENLNDSSVIQN